MFSYIIIIISSHQLIVLTSLLIIFTFIILIMVLIIYLHEFDRFKHRMNLLRLIQFILLWRHIVKLNLKLVHLIYSSFFFIYLFYILHGLRKKYILLHWGSLLSLLFFFKTPSFHITRLLIQERKHPTFPIDMLPFNQVVTKVSEIVLILQ